MLHNSHEFLPFVIYLKAPAIVEDPEAIIEENGTGEKEINGESESKEEETLIQTTNNSVPVVPIDPQAKRLYLESQAIREEFAKYFDMEITFDDLESALSKVKGALKNLSSETQWVPRNLVYSQFTIFFVKKANHLPDIPLEIDGYR